jgi:carbamoyl-phosphate synthase small subunit
LIYLKANQVPGISEVDTRRVTTLLRDEGAQRAVIFSKRSCGNLSPAEFAKQVLAKVPEMEGLELVSKVSCKAAYDFKPKSDKTNGTIVVYDYGVKTNILRIAARYPYQVRVVPYQTPADEVMAMKPRAVMLSNGPGDPEMVQGATEQIQALIGKVPIFAICMGHQLLGRALGCKTYKLKFGHHGINHPVKDLMTNKILITSQNHGFAIKAEDLKQKEISLSHVSLNDNTVEGFYSEKMKLMSIQFHPEAKPGPNDAGCLFESFVRGFVQ